MILNIRPESYEELLQIVDAEDVYVFAGGTDLMIRKRQWQGAERRFDKPIVYISHLEDLHGISESQDYYEIMACETQCAVAESDILPDYIKTPISKMATPSIRNLATIGGNVVNDASVGDSIPVLFALDAELVLRSRYGVRQVPIQSFILGKYKTDLKSNEILEKILIPKHQYDGFYYKKLGLRKASILSKLSVYMVHRGRGRDLEDVRLVLGALNERPIRLRDAERLFVEDQDLDQILVAYQDQMAARDDKRSTKQYREEITSYIIEYCLEEVM